MINTKPIKYDYIRKEVQPQTKHILKILTPPKKPRKIDRNKLFTNPNSKPNKKIKKINIKY